MTTGKFVLALSAGPSLRGFGYLDDAWGAVDARGVPLVRLHDFRNEATTVWERWELKKDPRHELPTATRLYASAGPVFCTPASRGVIPTAPGYERVGHPPPTCRAGLFERAGHRGTRVKGENHGALGAPVRRPRGCFVKHPLRRDRERGRFGGQAREVGQRISHL